VISRWWRTRPGVELFDLSTRWPLYLMSASEPLFAALLVGGQPSVRVRGAAAAAFALVAVAHTVSCVALLRRALGHRLGDPRPGRRLVVSAVALTVVGLALSPLATSTPGALLFEDGYPVGFALATMFAGGLTLALTPLVRLPHLVLLLALPAAAAAVVQELSGVGPQVSWAFDYLLLVVPFALTYRFSAWVLGVVWEIDRGRAVAARLAVAEERLRVARDLHDVLGRNLTLISANSELAARLVTRDPESAVERMLQVRQVAQDSMREARDIVGGARTADLEAELAGARSVLRSAGIETRVIGDGGHLPAQVQTALGWVVREATTNVLRHADPTRVRIELDAVTADVRRVARLRIENDGVREPAPGPRAGDGDGHGTGLAGLRDRLSAAGGTLVAGRQGDGRFSLEAQLPIDDVPALAPSGRAT
jgi:two-component system sensor histidine kinase DesK